MGDRSAHGSSSRPANGRRRSSTRPSTALRRPDPGGCAALEARSLPGQGLLANESELDPDRVGKRSYVSHAGQRLLVSGGAVGIAQFTAAGVQAVNSLRARRRRRGARVLFFDLDRARVPEEAIPAAAELLTHLINRFGRDGGITAYNSGGVGGRAVSRLGFWRARQAGRLQQVGLVRLQGDRFLLNVLARASWYREEAGLDPLYEPDILHPDSQRYVS
ncbi:MAG: transglycosylase SLT domain-containing protein, partial [Proteobacteria bacterium]|nr:transglycosylase SLT domain-containing protein [Pseudomonadota bacterium]